MKNRMMLLEIIVCLIFAMMVAFSAQAEMDLTLVGNEKAGYMIGEGIWSDFVLNMSEEDRQRQYRNTGFAQYSNTDYGLIILSMRGYDASAFGEMSTKEKMESILFGACDMLAPLYVAPYLDRLNVYTREDGVSIGIFYFAETATGAVSDIMLISVISDADGNGYLYIFDGIPDENMKESGNMIERMISSFSAENPIK